MSSNKFGLKQETVFSHTFQSYILSNELAYSGNLLVERAVLVDDVNEGDWPDDDQTRLIVRIRRHLDRRHVVVDLALLRHSTLDHLPWT
jgi:hypothetical protein